MPFNYKIRRRIRDGLGWLRYARTFSQIEQESAVRVALGDAGLDSAAGLLALNRLLGELRGRPFDFARDSIHWLAFACIGAAKLPVSRILEIGTFNGHFTAILADLFPAAEITTVDLPESDPILRSTYKRDQDVQFARFIDARARNLTARNVRFLQVNSVFLLDHVDGQFDLVWVDGGHLFPEIAWDLSSAHHLCRNGALVLCDDVIPFLQGQLTANVSSESAQVLRYITSRTGSTLHLFLKRCAFKHAGLPHRRKFVAMFERKPYLA